MRQSSRERRIRSTPRRLRFEFLESRQLLSTFTVIDTSDDVNDVGSLRNAITQSNLDGPGPKHDQLSDSWDGRTHHRAWLVSAGGDGPGDI